MTADLRNVGPSSVPAIRVGSDERDVAIARLSDAFARDVIPVEEFERRVESVYRAVERHELERLTSDLPEPTGKRGPRTDARDAATDTLKISATLSNVERAGVTAVPQRLELRAFCGNIELDLSGADFAAGVTEICVRATMSSIELRLPPHVTVQNEGAALLGSFDYPGTYADQSRMPDGNPRTSVKIVPRSVVRITGRALLSSVEVIHRPPVEDIPARMLEATTRPNGT